MQKLTLLAAALVLVFTAVGCANQGGSVDISAVEKQAAKEKELNKKGMANLPPGDGPAN